MQIYLSHKFFCTNYFKVKSEILRNSSTIFGGSHQRCSIKKVVLKHFAIFTGKHLCWSVFFNKVAGQKGCNFITKRIQSQITYLGSTILKNIANGCFYIFGKCFIRTSLARTFFIKGTF